MEETKEEMHCNCGFATPCNDVLTGSAYLDAFSDGRIAEHGAFLGFSTDGAQLQQTVGLLDLRLNYSRPQTGPALQKEMCSTRCYHSWTAQIEAHPVLPVPWVPSPLHVVTVLAFFAQVT